MKKLLSVAGLLLIAFYLTGCCNPEIAGNVPNTLRAQQTNNWCWGERRYDIIMSNPPYVSAAELGRLPREHRAEPVSSLRAARRGLAVIERIVAGARRHLTPRGILVVEVGNAAARVRRRFADLPLTWLAFEHGHAEVFLAHAADLPD